MPKFKLTVAQTCRAVREIEVEVQARSLKQAIAKQHERLMDGGPDFEDPGWVTYWDLIDENVYPLQVSA